MAALCIGGVCIPYSAILPFCAFVLQFLASKLVQLGLIPATWVPAALRPSPESSTSSEGTSTTKVRRSATEKRSSSTVSTASTTSSASTGEAVTNLASTEDWEEMMQNSDLTVVAKFTADWCKPCKAIDPVFVQLAGEYAVNGKVQFVRVDVDEYDEISQEANVVMMPTFALYDTKGKKVAAVHGAKEEKLKHMLDMFMGKKGQ